MQKLANKMLLASFGALALTATPASAAVTISAVDGSASYVGPFTFDFDNPTPEFTGGVLRNGTTGVAAQPFGSTGGYATSGPTLGGPGVLSLTAFADIDFISFLWGSIDTYNTLRVLDRFNNQLAIFTGSQVAAPATGNQTSAQTNRVVTLTFTGADRSLVDKLQFVSTSDAFEVDNFRVSAVPEPGTWMLMLLGFGAIGFAMRSRSKTKVRFQFA